MNVSYKGLMVTDGDLQHLLVWYTNNYEWMISVSHTILLHQVEEKSKSTNLSPFHDYEAVTYVSE